MGLHCVGVKFRSHISFSLTIAYFSVKLLQRNAIACSIYWPNMKELPAKPLIGRRSLFFRQNTRQEVKEEIQSILGAQIMTECKRYLGLPMAGGKSKVNTFKELQESVTKKVMWWKEKHISKAGREVLIKTVAQAIPTYLMSLIKNPQDNLWWHQLSSV